MKRFPKTILFIIVVFAASTCFVSAADFETDRFDVSVEVYEDNSWRVTETISMNFIEDSHGIYRYIPYKGYIYYEDRGESVKQYYKLNITDVEIPGYQYEKLYENNSILLKIGDADTYVKGPLTYEISYLVTAQEDGIESFDQFYWGLLPTDWNTSIDEGSFRVIMPGAFMSEDMEFLTGAYGSTDTELVNWSVENDVVVGNTLSQVITGEITRPLLAGEGVTLRILLPEGYFSGEKTNDWMLLWMLVLMVAAPVISLLLWFFFGRDPKVVRTVEFYPPEGSNSAEVGYIIDGYVDSKDMVALILDFANRGYLNITEIDGSFTLQKNGELPASAKDYERTVLNGIFKNVSEVSVEDLSGVFYPELIKAQKQLRSSFLKSKKSRIFTQNSIASRVFASLLMIIPLLAFNFLGTGYAYRPIEYGLILLIAAVGALACFLWLIVQYDRRHSLSTAKKVGGRIAPGIILAGCLPGCRGPIRYLLYRAAAIWCCRSCSFFNLLDIHHANEAENQERGRIARQDPRFQGIHPHRGTFPDQTVG